jgi:hypothetical protein
MRDSKATKQVRPRGRRRYLQPEPMLVDPAWVQDEASEGFAAPAYSYARNNPLHYTDPTGLAACDPARAADSHERLNNGDPCKAALALESMYVTVCVYGERFQGHSANKYDCRCLGATAKKLRERGVDRGCFNDMPLCIKR